MGSYVGARVLGPAGLLTWFLWPDAPARAAALVDGHDGSVSACKGGGDR